MSNKMIDRSVPIERHNAIPLDRLALDDEVVVSFGIDSRFLPHAAAVIASIVAHAPDARFRFLILFTDITPDRRAALQSVAPSARYDWIEIKDADVPEYRARAHFNRANLYRLGLEKLAPSDCHRVIYLDADVIVVRDLRELWRIDLQGNPIGGTIDAFAYFDFDVRFPAQWGLDPNGGTYINSGVLLIDLDAVRREKWFTKTIDFSAEHGEDMPFADQDAINYVFWGHCLLLPVEWNTIRERAIANIDASLPPQKRLNGRPPAIVHFSHKFKPWRKEGYTEEGYHPWSWLYWRYLARTPFYREVIATHGVGLPLRARSWLRWMKRRPPGLR